MKATKRGVPKGDGRPSPALLKVEQAFADRGWHFAKRPTGDFALVRIIAVRECELLAAAEYITAHGPQSWFDRWLADVEADVVLDGGDAA